MPEIDYRLLSDLGGPKPKQFGVLEATQRAFKVKDIFDQQKRQGQLTDIFSKNVIKDQRGQSSLNKQGVLTDLYKVQPKEALKFEKEWKVKAQSQADLQKQQLQGLKLRAQILSGVRDPMAAAQQMVNSGLDVSDMPPPGRSDWNNWAQDAIAMGTEAQFTKPLTQKDILAEDRKRDLEGLSEEFRTELLPNIDISRLVTDKNARNKLIKDINESKYWDTPLAKQVMKGLKGKSSNLADKLGALMAKMEIDETKLTGPEKKGLGAVVPAVDDMNKLVDMYHAGDTGTVGSVVSALASRAPVFGERVFPDITEYRKHKRSMAERFLRIATGAAAPQGEVKRYSTFLPEWGDTPRQAQAAIQSFMANVRAEAIKSVTRLKALGTKVSLAKASRIEKNVQDMLSQVKSINIESEAPTTAIQFPDNPAKQARYEAWKKTRGAQ